MYLTEHRGHNYEPKLWCSYCHKNTLGIENGTPNLVRRGCSHRSSKVASAKDMYSASILDLETANCFLAHQDTKLLPRNTHAPDVDLLPKNTHEPNVNLEVDSS